MACLTICIFSSKLNFSLYRSAFGTPLVLLHFAVMSAVGACLDCARIRTEKIFSIGNLKTQGGGGVRHKCIEKQRLICARLGIK